MFLVVIYRGLIMDPLHKISHEQLFISGLENALDIVFQKFVFEEWFNRFIPFLSCKILDEQKLSDLIVFFHCI